MEENEDKYGGGKNGSNPKMLEEESNNGPEGSSG